MAKVFTLVEAEGANERICLMEYEDGRLFLGTSIGAVSITRAQFYNLAAKAGGIAIAMGKGEARGKKEQKK